GATTHDAYASLLLEDSADLVGIPRGRSDVEVLLEVRSRRGITREGEERPEQSMAVGEIGDRDALLEQALRALDVLSVEVLLRRVEHAGRVGDVLGRGNSRALIR